jgi:hypothetical protein
VRLPVFGRHYEFPICADDLAEPDFIALIDHGRTLLRKKEGILAITGTGSEQQHFQALNRLSSERIPIRTGKHVFEFGEKIGRRNVHRPT